MDGLDGTIAAYRVLLCDSRGWREYRRYKTKRRALLEGNLLLDRMRQGYYPQLDAVRVVAVLEQDGPILLDGTRPPA